MQQTSNLGGQSQQQQQNQQQQYQQQQQPTNPIDTNFLLQQLVSQGATTATALQAFALTSKFIADHQKPKAPITKFPSRDGKLDTVPLLMACIVNYKGDPFFLSVADWTTMLPGTEQQSCRIFSDMIAALPAVECDQFLNDPDYVDDGFRMLTDFLEYINPTNPEHRIHDIRRVSGLEQGADEPTAS